MNLATVSTTTARRTRPASASAQLTSWTHCRATWWVQASQRLPSLTSTLTGPTLRGFQRPSTNGDVSLISRVTVSPRWLGSQKSLNLLKWCLCRRAWSRWLNAVWASKFQHAVLTSQTSELYSVHSDRIERQMAVVVLLYGRTGSNAESRWQLVSLSDDYLSLLHSFILCSWSIICKR